MGAGTSRAEGARAARGAVESAWGFVSKGMVCWLMGKPLLGSAAQGSIQLLYGPACPAERCQETLFTKPVPPSQLQPGGGFPEGAQGPGQPPIRVLVLVLLLKAWKAAGGRKFGPHFPVASCQIYLHKLRINSQ